VHERAVSTNSPEPAGRQTAPVAVIALASRKGDAVRRSALASGASEVGTATRIRYVYPARGTSLVPPVGNALPTCLAFIQETAAAKRSDTGDLLPAWRNRQTNHAQTVPRFLKARCRFESCRRHLSLRRRGSPKATALT
jgi:hypothetical protein